MIGLDTNILVRLLVGDDPAQTAQAKRFVETRCTRQSPAFINCVVLAELVWVLARSYRYGRSDIAAAVESLMVGDDRVIEHHDDVRDALADYKTRPIDFIDALIVRINSARGCETTATFDRKAGRLAGFMPVK